MADGTVIDIPRWIGERPIGAFQYRVVALCAVTVFLDGYDTQSVAFVAPSIAAEWHLERAALGPIFVASLVGLLIGALTFGLLADKLGRRRMVMACTLVFGAFTLATAQADSVAELLVFRFITGLGLGGGMPNAIALTAEYCPERRRATLVMIMFTGFSLGAAAAGGVAALLIPTFGWRAVWYVGGALPLLLLPLQYAALPESIRFLLIAGAPAERVAALLERIDRGFRAPAGARFETGEAAAHGVPVVHLFREGRAPGTLLLWLLFFMSLLDLFFLQNWIPVISHGAGIPVRMAVVIGTLFQVGGVVAALFVGFPIDRYGALRVLPWLYGAGCLFVVAIGQAGASVPALMLLTFGAGFCIIGGQNSANAAAAIFYPTAMRSTGVGWCLGVGRVGAIIGPLLGAFLISLHWPNSSIFVLGGLPALCAAVAVFAMGRIYRRGPMAEGAAPVVVHAE
jgi:AAHS family 4-hydroxybenzoate transporter-like MFS transporter